MDGQRIGPVWGGSGAIAPFTAGWSGTQRVMDGHGKYVDAALGGRMFFTSVAAAAPTAYVGAAGGTPLLAAHNPTGSAVVHVLVGVSAAPRVVASAVGHTTIALWAGASATPTGTQTAPKSASTYAAGGKALGFANAALTGSTALGLVMPLHEYFWGTSVGVSHAPTFIDLNGMVVLFPGMQAAVGATIAPASLTWDIALWWEELPLYT